MLMACSRCGKIHPWGQCPKGKPERIYKKKEPTEITRFRSSGPWQRKQKEILQRDRYLCKMCLARGILTVKNLSVHHIIPIREDPSLKLADDNLITLCGRDHAIVESDPGFRPVLMELAKSPPEKILK